MVKRSFTSSVLHGYACSFNFPFEQSEQKQKDIFLPSLVAFLGIRASQVLELVLFRDHLTHSLQGTVEIL